MKSKGLVLFSVLSFLNTVHAEDVTQATTLSGAELRVPMERPHFSTADVSQLLSEAIKNNPLIEASEPTFSSLPLFPLVTQNFTPGEVVSQRVNYPQLQQSFFVIGADSKSVQWLATNQQQLKKLHAEGFVVNIGSAKELQALYAEITDVPLTPINGSQLATRFHLGHYPVLVSKNLMEQ